MTVHYHPEDPHMACAEEHPMSHWGRFYTEAHPGRWYDCPICRPRVYVPGSQEQAAAEGLTRPRCARCGAKYHKHLGPDYPRRCPQ